MELQNEPKFNLIQMAIAAKTWVENVVKSDDLGVDSVLNTPEQHNIFFMFSILHIVSSAGYVVLVSLWD